MKLEISFPLGWDPKLIGIEEGRQSGPWAVSCQPPYGSRGTGGLSRRACLRHKKGACKGRESCFTVLSRISLFPVSSLCPQYWLRTKKQNVHNPLYLTHLYDLWEYHHKDEETTFLPQTDKKATGSASYWQRWRIFPLSNSVLFPLRSLQELKFRWGQQIPSTATGARVALLGHVFHHHHKFQQELAGNSLENLRNQENTLSQVGIQKSHWYYSCFQRRLWDQRLRVWLS